MDMHAHITRRLALLPDDKLTQLLEAARGSGGVEPDDVPRSERVEAISRELRARGIFGPPWWSAGRPAITRRTPRSAGTCR